ncbi:MAG: allophanate hydrolase [Hyphomicrobiaceae bacterium]
MHIAGLRAAYGRGLSPVDVIARVFDIIDEVGDPGIFITLVEKRTLLESARALREQDRASLPLWGIPFAVKDNIAVAGLTISAAAPAFARVATKNANAVQRLLDAGALMIGKTNLDQFATGLVGVRTPYPVPRNSFNADFVPGGSSSGSAVAVARGIVAFALGTDTAGSGRVPAGLNNIVGLKPSVGAVSSVGMMPACRTLDCVSVFATTVDDAWTVYKLIAGKDATDPYSRPIELGELSSPAPQSTIGIPRSDDLVFFGDEQAEAAWRASVEILRGLGANLVEVDFTPFFETAKLLYDGPWVAERYAAQRTELETRPREVLPVTREVIEKARSFSAADAFDGLYKLADLKLASGKVLATLDALVVPTVPTVPRLSELAADPIGPNARLGTYTNFVNLLDLAAISVPGPFRPDGLPAGITLIGPRGGDSALASMGRAFHHAAGVPMGATGAPLPPPRSPSGNVSMAGRIEIAVVGAHLSGMALNHELRDRGGLFLRAVDTESSYRLFALPGGPPKRPGLVRVSAGTGFAIATEVWSLPVEGFGRFVASVPAPLAIGTLLLQDGTRPKGFLCESAELEGAAHISEFGGWRAFAAVQH